MERVLSYKKTKNAINDLKSVVDSSFSPLADNALSFLDEMDLDYRFHWSQNFQRYSALTDLLEFQLKHVVSFYLKHNSLIKDFKLNISHQTFTLDSWNQLLGELDQFSKLLTLFPLKNDLIIELKNNKVFVSADIFKSDINLDKRGAAYRLTREYLKGKKWLTYELAEKDTHHSLITFQIDFSHSEFMDLKFEIRDQSFLLFSNSLKNYQILLDKFDLNLEHLVLEIDENCQLNVLNAVSQSQYLTNSTFSLYHFPFLFRPVSLIIPIRGNLESKSERSQDRRIIYKNIDFFDAFNK